MLRVYTSIQLNIINDGFDSINILERDYQDINKIDKEYNDIYGNHFSNFNSNDTRFEYLVDHGNMLIISDGAFMNTMQPLVDWKNKKGIPTEIIDVAEIFFLSVK